MRVLVADVTMQPPRLGVCFAPRMGMPLGNQGSDKGAEHAEAMSFAIADEQALPESARNVIRGSRFDFVALFARPRHGTLPTERALMVRTLRREQRVLLESLLETHDVDQFSQRRFEILKPYWDLSKAIPLLLDAKLAVSDWAQMARESVDRFADEFMERGAERFGPDATEEILFAISIIGRVGRLLREVVETPPADPTFAEEERKLGDVFQAEALWCDFHLHLLVVLMRNSESVSPLVLQETLTGLRSSVRMYGALSAALRLRRRDDQPLMVEEVPLDAEDQLLLKSSACDARSALRDVH